MNRGVAPKIKTLSRNRLNPLPGSKIAAVIIHLQLATPFTAFPIQRAVSPPRNEFVDEFLASEKLLWFARLMMSSIYKKKRKCLIALNNFKWI